MNVVIFLSCLLAMNHGFPHFAALQNSARKNGHLVRAQLCVGSDLSQQLQSEGHKLIHKSDHACPQAHFFHHI